MGAIYGYIDYIYVCYLRVYWWCIWVLITCTI